MPAGPHMVGASYGRTSVAAVHQGRRPGNVSMPFSTVVDDMSGISVAYSYALSMRTQVFAAYGALNNEALGQAAYAIHLRPAPGGSSTIAALGLRHSF